MSEKQLHVVFGSGQIGTPLTKILLEQGHDVRVVRRSAGATTPGATLVQGDAGDAAFVTEVTRDAAVLYHVMNPPYFMADWTRELPRLASSLIAAAGRNHARLVVLDNLYMLGKPNGRRLSEALPSNPCSRKGEVRAQVAAQYFDAHKQGAARVISGRASDFYGPLGLGTYFGEMLWKRVFAGKSAQVITNPDTLHTYHFTHDVAAGLATLGGAPDDAYGKWWMLPAAPAISTRAMIAELTNDQPKPVAIERLPKVMLSALGLFMPMLKELGEMNYQWEEDFVVDDTRFREGFGAKATPILDGARATAAWAKAAFGGGS